MKPRGFNFLQKISLTLMVLMIFITFFAANLHAILWQSSQWLVGTVLPAVVVELTNDERALNNAGPLHRNTVLDAAAKLKAQHMAQNQYFAHYAPDGTTPWHWFDKAGYVYAHAGENLAIHFTDSAEVVEAWMDSPTHRKNIVDQRFTEIGVGTAKGTYDGYDTVYVVQLFGTPAVPPAPVPPEPEPAAPTPTSQPEEPAVLALETASEAGSLSSERPSLDDTDDETVIVPEPVPETELVVATETEVTPQEALPSDVVVVEMPLISTSSGLAIASIVEANSGDESAGIAGIATRPHLILQIIYSLLALAVVFMLVTSAIIEFKRVHPVQMGYSAGMLAVMGFLLWIHTVLVHGAVIA